jgi:hypothetical protein
MARSTPNAQDEALFPEIPSKRSIRTYSHRKIGNDGLLPKLRDNVPARKRTERVFDGTATRRYEDEQDAQKVVPEKEMSDEPAGFEEEYEEYDFADYSDQEHGGTIGMRPRLCYICAS